jgi:hypothetical protein
VDTESPYTAALRDIIALELRGFYRYLRQLDATQSEAEVQAELALKPCCHTPAKLPAYRLCASGLLDLLKDLGCF